MTQWSCVHLMFCEGAHDAAFLNHLLKTELGFAQTALKLSELPYPIANILQQSFKTRAAEDLRLDLAKKFYLPDYMVKLETMLVMVFSYGGSNRQASMLPFLESVFALLEAPSFANVSQSAEPLRYAFTLFADADTLGLSNQRARLSADFATIDGTGWLSNIWTDIYDTRAVKQDTKYGPTAAYIWRKWTEDNGTLEDVLLECLASSAGIQQTLHFLDTRFNWSPPAGAPPEQVCAYAAKRLKAAFCVEGQREKSGMSLGVILGQTNLLSSEAIQRSPAAQDCLKFLRYWLA